MFKYFDVGQSIEMRFLLIPLLSHFKLDHSDGLP